MLSLQKSYEDTLTDKGTHFEISAFRGSPAGNETKVKCIARVKAAFPALNPEFHSLLLERFQEVGASDERMRAAVKFVIDNCEYPTPTIANFMSYDRKVKLYNYHQMADKCANGEPAFETHKGVRITENQPKKMWASIQDVERYNLPLWENKDQ